MKKLNLILSVTASFVPIISMVSCNSSELSKKEFEDGFKKNSSEFTSESSGLLTNLAADYAKIATSVGNGSTDPIKTFLNKSVAIFEKFVAQNKELVSKSGFFEKADKDKILGVLDKSLASIKGTKDKYAKSYSLIEYGPVLITFATDLGTLSTSIKSSALEINAILTKYKIKL